VHRLDIHREMSISKLRGDCNRGSGCSKRASVHPATAVQSGRARVNSTPRIVDRSMRSIHRPSTIDHIGMNVIRFGNADISDTTHPGAVIAIITHQRINEVVNRLPFLCHGGNRLHPRGRCGDRSCLSITTSSPSVPSNHFRV
jgi:hypothetical protein